MRDNTRIFAELEEVIDEGYPYWERHRPGEALSVYNDTKEKVQRDSLAIQLYGAYNAGKSTLINVLFGAEMAQTGEIPTTDKIDVHDWNGIKVIDSPGTNAPIEHENVTAEELKKNDLVIFVIRTGEYDVRDVYERLVANLEAQKEVFIVLNYENVGDEDEQDPWHFASYIEDQMIRVAEEADAARALSAINSGNINIVPVNLASASRGLQEGKEKLADNSGVHLLFNYLNEWIREFDNQRQRVDGAKRFIKNNYLDPVIDQVGSQGIGHEIKEQQEAVNHLFRVRDNTLQKAENQARQIGIELKSELWSDFENSKGQEDIENSVHRQLTAAANSFQEWLSSELQNEVILSLDEFSQVGLAENNGEPSLSSGGDVEGYVYEGLRTVSSNPRIVDESLANGLTKVIEYMGKIPWLEGGKFVSFLGGVAQVLQRAGPAVATLASVGTALWDAKKEDEQNKQAREQARKMRQVVDSIVDDFQKAAREQAQGFIGSAFEESIQAQKAELQRLESDVDSNKKDYAELMALSRKLESITVH